ncbi:MAG: choice-of-anchor E domain-containing protein [Phycisphaerae bacterium]
MLRCAGWVAAALAVSVPGQTLGATISYTRSVELQPTDWVQNLYIPKFDPAAGHLTGISVDFAGTLDATAYYENLDVKEHNIELDMSATISLLRPDLTPLAITVPALTLQEKVGAYDDSIDFGGLSGSTVRQTIDNHDPYYLHPGTSDFDLYVGLDTLVLPVTAIGNARGTGPVDWVVGFNMLASAQYTVVYRYIPAPEPATAGLLLLALGAAAAAR